MIRQSLEIINSTASDQTSSFSVPSMLGLGCPSGKESPEPTTPETLAPEVRGDIGGGT